MKINSRLYKCLSDRILPITLLCIITRLWMPCPAAALGAEGGVAPVTVPAFSLNAINTTLNTSANSLHISALDICTTNFLSAHTNSFFQIAVSTNLACGAWTTNSALHSITGAVTTVTLTNTADRAFFRIITE